MKNEKTLESELTNIDVINNVEKPKRIRDYAFDGLIYGAGPVFAVGLGATMASYTPIVPEVIYFPGMEEGVHLKFLLQLAGIPASVVVAIGTGIIGAGINTARGLIKKAYSPKPSTK